MTLTVVVVLGIVLLAKGRIAWAGQERNAAPTGGELQSENSVSYAAEPGSVKPPPPVQTFCKKNGHYSVGGEVIMEIKDLKPGYCVETELSSSFYPVPTDLGGPLADFLFLRIYYDGNLIDTLPSGDGTITACYAIPPEKQAQIYYYDFYWNYDFDLKMFTEQTGSLPTWVPAPVASAENKTACASTQFSGVYGLIGK